MFVFKIPDMRKLFFFRDNIINKKDTITAGAVTERWKINLFQSMEG
jgi:hypothetical protein